MTTATEILAGRYRLFGRLAEGAMADVWAADDLRLERSVAVKLLRRDDETAQRCFRRELGALSRMNHPAIVRLFDAGTHRGRPFMVIERVRGRTLRQALADGPLPAETARILGVNLADALAHAHDLQIVHRDVKPSNVLLDELGLAHLADFGIAEPAPGRRASARGADADVVWGTAGYAAPEQLLGGTVEAAADVYALGLVLLEALTGHREFPGTPLAAAVARLRRTPTVPAHLPAPWPPLLTSMTARDPHNRPSCRTVAACLAQAAVRPRAADDAEVPTADHEEAPSPATAASGPVVPVGPPPVDAVAPVHRKAPRGALVLATAAAVAAAAVLALPIGRGTPSEPVTPLRVQDEVAMVERSARSRVAVLDTDRPVSRSARYRLPPQLEAEGVTRGVGAGIRAGSGPAPDPGQVGATRPSTWHQGAN